MMSLIATSSDELKFHQWSNGELHQFYKSAQSEEGPVKTISWNRDGSWIVLVSSSGSAEIIGVKDNIKVLQTISDIYQPTCATFQNNTKKNIAIGTLSGQILVYDIKAKSVRKRFPRISSTTFCVQYNSKDSHIAAACRNGKVLVFNSMTANLSCSYAVPKSETVSAINFHRVKRNMLAAGSDEGILAIWDINRNETLCDVKVHHAPITDISFSPIRSDLLITGGMDRRFSFYDLLAKKCIIEIEVSSSITSLDFSHCGTYLGLGSQNGNVVVYDTRNFSKPISAFSAHAGKKICHAHFQKVQISNNNHNNSSVSIPIEEGDTPKRQENESKNLSIDSLGLIGWDEPSAHMQTDLEKNPLKETEDSFLLALGLDNSCDSPAFVRRDSSVGVGISDDVRKLKDVSKRLSLYQNNINQPPEQKLIANSKQLSSTPKVVMENLPHTTVSPITISSNVASSQPCNVPLDDLKQIVRDAVREEIQNQTETFKNEIRLELAESLRHLRRCFLDLKLSLVKGFVDVEEKIEKINSVSIKDIVCDDFLINKNKKLVKEVETLKEYIVKKDLTRSSKFN